MCDRSTSPQWGEAFHFLVHDPKEEMLIVKVNALNVSTLRPETSCYCQEHLKLLTDFILVSVVVQCMGSVNGICGSSCEAAAV